MLKLKEAAVSIHVWELLLLRLCHRSYLGLDVQLFESLPLVCRHNQCWGSNLKEALVIHTCST